MLRDTDPFIPVQGQPSVSQRPWRLRRRPQDKNLANTASLARRFLAVRDDLGASQIDHILGFSLREMADPALMPDGRVAAERLLRAIEVNEKITVYGDYDVDGVTSSALLFLALKAMFGVEIDVYIPHRLKEGYGLNSDAIRNLSQSGTQLLVTVDNGSSAIKEVALANTLGMDVIIIDHHQVSNPEPDAFAHLNPHRKSSKYPFKGLAAVGVAFMLLVEVRRRVGDYPNLRLSHNRIDGFLDLVALGTVADVAPLQDINRAMVRYGLDCMQRSPRLGLEALCHVSGVDINAINEGDLGYKLGPRVNAAGRLENAADGFRLLVSDDAAFTASMAQRIDQQNAERRAIQSRIETEALEQATALVHGEQPEILILHGEDWHPGIVGIVASRVVETFQRPVFCLALDGNIWKGSGRSTPGVHLKALLDHCQDSLLRYGGHVAAAGVTLNRDALDTFKATAARCVSMVKDEDALPVYALDIDLEVEPSIFTFENLEDLDRAGPFGHENPAPRFLLRNVTGQTRLMKEKHLKAYALQGAASYVEAIGWGMGEYENWFLRSVDIVCTARIESWRGRRRITLNILDLRPHEPTRVAK